MLSEIFLCKKCNSISTHSQLEKNDFLCPSCNFVIDSDNLMHDVSKIDLMDLRSSNSSSIAFDKEDANFILNQALFEAVECSAKSSFSADGESILVSINLVIPKSKFRIGQLVVCPSGEIDMVTSVLLLKTGTLYNLLSAGSDTPFLESQLTAYIMG